MLNIDVFNAINTPPRVRVNIKNKRLEFTRESPQEVGKRAAMAITATIKKHGPICANDIAKITKHSGSGVRSCINRINDKGMFIVERMVTPGSSKKVFFYSMASL